jgi:hypothetical protein
MKTQRMKILTERELIANPINLVNCGIHKTHFITLWPKNNMLIKLHIQ